MKSTREILFKTLVENLNVDPSFLSRIEGNDPVSIELKGGEEIFIKADTNDEKLHVVINIPTRDHRVTYTKAPKILEILQMDNQIFLNADKDKLVLLSSISLQSKTLEKELSDKLNIFNKAVNYLKV